MEEEKFSFDELVCGVEKKLKELVNAGIDADSVNYIGKLIDIHKDIEEEKYYKTKEEYYMRYRDYEEEYGRRSRDSRGRYTDSYGRRGVPGSGRGRYRGEEMIDEVYNAYNDYMDNNEYGNYGTGESMQKIEIMADSLMDFIHHLKKEAKTPEEKQLIDEKLREIGRM